MNVETKPIRNRIRLTTSEQKDRDALAQSTIATLRLRLTLAVIGWPVAFGLGAWFF